MRKILFAILAIALFIFTGLVIYRGTNIGKFEIWGIKKIVEENEIIDQKNADLGILVNTSYPEAISKLNNTGELLEEKKKEYEEQATMISNSKYLQKEKYKLEFLWTKIGNYAKDNKVTPKMQVTNGSANEVYNLIITVVGRYSNVASFIYAIENDSRLGFKIEDFKMTRASTTTEDEEKNNHYVEGTFTCKEIRIDVKSLDNENGNGNNKNTKNETNENDTNNEKNNNTNTTNTTSATDTNTSNTNQTETGGNTNSTENTTNSQSNSVDSNIESSNENTTTNTTT